MSIIVAAIIMKTIERVIIIVVQVVRCSGCPVGVELSVEELSNGVEVLFARGFVVIARVLQ